MYADILNAIAKAIRERYTDLAVYTEFDGQQLTPPCITLGMEKNRFVQGRPPYYEAVYAFVLNYYPLGSTQNADRGEMSETLYQLTEMLSLADGTKIRGTDISSEVKDGVLIFKISYALKMKCSSNLEDDLMGVLTVEEGVSNGREY